MDGSSFTADINNISGGEKTGNHPEFGAFFMNLKNKYALPEHLKDDDGLPRSQKERLLMIKRRVEEGFYDSKRVKLAVAEAFLDPPFMRRAGDQAHP